MKIAAICLLMALAAWAQPAAKPLAFEVASVKVHDGPRHEMMGFHASGPRLTLAAYWERGLITEALHLRDYQVSFAEPSMPRQELYYDIVAKAEGDGAPTRRQFDEMLLTLLVERFDLRFHHEKKEMPVYALVVDKNGPKFKESAADAPFSAHMGVHGRNQNVTASQYTIAMLADDIGSSFFLDRPVVDQTGLTGAYDLKVEATPEFRIDNNPDPGDIRIFAALQEQLGLRLVAQKALVDVVVVDHLGKPSAN